MLNDGIMHLNERSISCNFNELVVYLDSQNEPLANCLSEAWINEDFDKKLYNILDYSPLIFAEGNVVMTAYLCLFTGP